MGQGRIFQEGILKLEHPPHRTILVINLAQMIGVFRKVLEKEVIRNKLRIHPPPILLKARPARAPLHKHIQAIIEQLEVHEVHGLEALAEEAVVVGEVDGGLPLLLLLKPIVMKLIILCDAHSILTLVLNKLLFAGNEIGSLNFALVCAHYAALSNYSY